MEPTNGALQRLLSELLELDRERLFLSTAMREDLDREADMIEREVTSHVTDVFNISDSISLQDTLNDLAFCITLSSTSDQRNKEAGAMVRRLEYIFEGVDITTGDMYGK